MIEICSDCAKRDRIVIQTRRADGKIVCPHRNYSVDSLIARGLLGPDAAKSPFTHENDPLAEAKRWKAFAEDETKRRHAVASDLDVANEAIDSLIRARDRRDTTIRNMNARGDQQAKRIVELNDENKALANECSARAEEAFRYRRERDEANAKTERIRELYGETNPTREEAIEALRKIAREVVAWRAKVAPADATLPMLRHVRVAVSDTMAAIDYIVRGALPK